MSQPRSAPPAAPALPSLPVRLLCGTSIVYTALSFCLLLLSLLFSDSVMGVSPLSMILLIPLSLCLVLAREARRSPTLPAYGKVILHILLVAGGCFLCGLLPARPNAKGMLYLSLLFLLIYGVTMVVILLLSRRKGQKEADNTPYVSQFGPRS